jgi:hypothetical protein
MFSDSNCLGSPFRADATAQLRLRVVLEDELGFEDAPEIPIGAVEPVLGAEPTSRFRATDAVTWPVFSEARSQPRPKFSPHRPIGLWRDGLPSRW